MKTLGFQGHRKKSFRNLYECSTQVKDIKEYGKTLTAAQGRLVNCLSIRLSVDIP